MYQYTIPPLSSLNQPIAPNELPCTPNNPSQEIQALLTSSPSLQYIHPCNFYSGTFSSNCRLTDHGPHAHSGVIVGRVEQQRLAKKPNPSKRGKKWQSGCPPVTITDGAVMRPERYLLADRQGPQFGLEFYGDRNRFTSPIREPVVMLRTGWVYRVACWCTRYLLRG